MTEIPDFAYTDINALCGGIGMNAVTFFLTIFFGIFGAYYFIGTVYNAVLELLAKGRTVNGAKKRRIHNNKRNGGGYSL